MYQLKPDHMEFITQFNLPLETLPFSRFGSYLVVDHLPDKDRKHLYIREISGGDGDPGLQFALEVYSHGDQLTFKDLKVVQTTTQLTISPRVSAPVEDPDHLQAIEICMPTQDTLAIRVRGLKLILTYQGKRYDSAYFTVDPERTLEITGYAKEIKYALRTLEGTPFLVDAPWERIGSSHIRVEFPSSELQSSTYLISRYGAVETPAQRDLRGQITSYEVGHKRVLQENLEWHLGDDRFHKCRTHTQRCRLVEANQILWSNVVAPEGLLSQAAVYMNKRYMTNIWSWDNCFSALALAPHYPQLAWGQIQLFFDLQDGSGGIPDYANNRYTSFSSVKPPIYGWLYPELCRVQDCFRESAYAAVFYDAVSKNTQFWLENRMTDRGLCAYYHGNESGWDNGTFFAEGVPVVAPDLACFLVLQMEVLGDLAALLGRPPAESAQWLAAARAMETALIDHLWRPAKQGFGAIRLETGDFVETGDSLMAFLPLLLGNRLPLSVQKLMLMALSSETRFLGRYGLATEALSSPQYLINGYWRGPIWAPVTLLMHSALEGLASPDLASPDLAGKLRARWLRLIEKSGFYENFDPTTGEGLVEPAFAWTAAVYLHLLGRD